MEKLQKLSFEVAFEQPLNQEVTLAGFLFYCGNILLQAQPVRKNLLQFDLSQIKTNNSVANREINTNELRLLIAPVSEKAMASITSIEGLDKYKPYEAVIKRNADQQLSILPIPGIISQFWPRCKCRVTGKVSKWFNTASGWENRAVCRARVHICDVDAIRYWIYKIPDSIIAKIPDYFLNPKELVRFPKPLPDPPPFADGIGPVTVRSLFQKSSTDEKIMQQAAALPELSVSLRQTFASGNLDNIRNSIVENYAILHPWFCMWPTWWHYFYRLTELAVDYTDAAGRFDATVTYNCFRDKPDIYIWVEYLINGSWQTVYRPAIPCHIRWNYVCSSPINIQITDPRVPGNCCCNCSLPGDLIWLRYVGRTSVVHINQDASISAPPPLQAVPYNRIGLTDASAWGDPNITALNSLTGDYKRPFGGSPNLYMGFGSSLPNSTYFYYRWSYKQIKDADLNDVTDEYKTLEPAGGAVYKGYQYEYVDVNGDTQSAPNSVKLGPVSAGGNDNLYIIPPQRPNMAPFNVTETSPDWHELPEDMLTISFDSTKLKNGTALGGDGLYEFILELFDGAGNKVAAIPRSVLKAPDYNNHLFSVNAPDSLLALNSATTASSFKMQMRIENGKCAAEVFKVNVNGAPASLDCCGFVKYAPGGVEADLSISFEATQPRNFAVFSFGVVKGTCGGVANANADGMVIDDAGGYNLTSGVYEKHFTPAALLDNCYNNGTGKAAFAETLHVYAMATDGYARLSGNDDSDVAAFALEP